jgi:hypothetical protein
MGIFFPRRGEIGAKESRRKAMNIEQGFIWIVGRIDPHPETAQWHIQGVTESEQLAIQMCADETYFIGPVPLNTALSHNRVEWIGSYFPLGQTNDATRTADPIHTD